jgi:uncharacterized alkaline shock family protein YloU
MIKYLDIKYPDRREYKMAEIKDYISYSDNKGSINISEDVIAAIAGNAVLETDGVAGLYTSPARDLAEIMGKKGVSKGVKVKVEEEGISAEVFILSKPDISMAEMGKAVQQSVKGAIESTTGINVLTVNVHVCGINCGNA